MSLCRNAVHFSLLFLFVAAALGGVVMVCMPAHADGYVYSNPFRLPNEWPEYGSGDPFILRWNGTYYMYPSTNTHFGGSVGIRVWQSEDLVHWEYAGNVTDEIITKNAYAPEVVYWNGYFYMYTSPGGQGHYVLRSDSPTGPFTVQTDNIGMSIDGSVFIDDDGRWYFTHAGHLGIRGRSMIDPYTMGPEHVLNSNLGGWTEGSFIIKHNDYYYLTYTGNHLLSPGYRVHYSVAQDGPLGPYTVPDDSLLLISTKGDFSGLGHSATVLGPDMDSYYIVYHSMPKRDGPHVRQMNIDRLAFNGSKMVVLGPTNYDQPAPPRPDFYTWIERDGLAAWDELARGDEQLLLSKARTEANFTAEFNFDIPEWVPGTNDGRLGVVFSYVDADNFSRINIDLDGGSMTLFTVVDGTEAEKASVSLLDDTDFAALHTLRVVSAGNSISVYMDNLLRLQTDIDGPAGGRIGYVYADVEPGLYYTAFSNQAGGSSDFDAIKPVPGTIEAVHYRRANGHPARNAVRTDTKADGVHYVTLQTGDAVTYNVNVAADGRYGVAFMVHTASEAVVEATVGDDTVGTWTVSPAHTDTADRGWVKMRVGDVYLPAGLYPLRLTVTSGEVAVEYAEIFPVTDEPFVISSDLTDARHDGWSTYGAHRWSVTEYGYRAVDRSDTMTVVGRDEWTDYRVAVDLQVDGSLHPGEAGLLLRATHPSYREGQTNDAVIGYYVAFDGEHVSLRKLQYDSRPLMQVNVGAAGAGTHRLVAEAVNNTVTVYWNDLENPVMQYTDTNGFMYGAPGLRSDTGMAVFRNLDISCLACPVYGAVNIAGEQIRLQPARRDATVRLPFNTLQPPAVHVVELSQLSGAQIVDPTATIEIQQPAAIPGEALINVVAASGRLLHTVRVNVVKETVPTVRVAVNDGPPLGHSWAGEVKGPVLLHVHVDGPDELLHHVRVTASHVQAGEVGPELELYSGAGTPHDLVWQTTDFIDGTYEIAVTVQSVYGTERTVRHRLLVENRVVIIDDFEPPVDSWFGLLSRRKTVAQTDGWEYATGEPDLFFGDRHRLVAMGAGPESLTWEARGIEDFSIVLYSEQRIVDENVSIHVSRDAKQWEPVSFVVSGVESSPAGQLRLQLDGNVNEPSEANFLRLTLQDSEGFARIPLGQLRFTALPDDGK